MCLLNLFRICWRLRRHGLLVFLCLLISSALPVGVSATQVDGRLYVEACEERQWHACNVLGLMHERGERVSLDLLHAARLYERACTIGDLPIACANLGRLLERGEGVTRDTARARKLYTAACDAGEELACALAASGRLESRDTLSDPDWGAGRVVGRVTDAVRGTGVPDVEITFRDRIQEAGPTNGEGWFIIEDLRPGPTEVSFARLGYGERTVLLDIEPGKTVEVEVSMSAEPIALEPIQVIARSTYLEHNGFYARRRVGFGAHLARRELEELTLHRISNVFSRVPGVNIRRRTGQTVAVSMRGGCMLAVFMDGVRVMQPYDLDSIPVQQIEAIEVYQGVETPVQFLANSCGSILIWTR